MGEALKVLVGPPRPQGLSASTVSRLKQVWGEEYRQSCEERLDADRWVYVWADGIYSGLRAEQTKLCALVVIGVNERGEKRFLAIEDGVPGIDTELARGLVEVEVPGDEYPGVGHR